MDTKVIPKTWESLMNSWSILPVIVKSIENFYDANWSMEPNRHDHFEMVYVKKGFGRFNMENGICEIGPDDIIIIKPGYYHKLTVKSKSGCEFIVLSFKFENRIAGEYSEASLEDFLDFVSGSGTGPYITIKVNQKNQIVLLLNRIIIEKKGNEPGSEFLNYLLIMELFVMLSRALKLEWENSIKSKSPKVKELINEALNYIEINYEKNISLSDISNYVFLSSGYFTRAFKEQTGMSPIHYIVKTRVEKSCELLKDTSDKVGDIALTCGFSTQQRFNEAFRKYKGCTPLEYRKNNNML